MQSVIFESNSKSNLKLLADLAKKIGVSVKFLTDEEKEDMGLLKAIKTGKTGKHIDTEMFIKKLRK